MNRKELVLFDEKNPRSIVRLLPEEIGKRLKAAWETEDGYLFGLPENRLRRELSKRGRNPTSTDSRIRLQFWLEYDRIQIEDRMDIPKMNMAYVIGFAMPKESFYKYYIEDNCLLAWMLCPPVQYVDALEEVLREALDRIRESMEIEFLDAEGKPQQQFLSWLRTTEAGLYKRWSLLRDDKGGKFPLSVATDETEVPGESDALNPIDEQAKREEERQERRKKLAELAAQRNAT